MFFAPFTPIPDESWHAFVEECLAEAPETGHCTTWASTNNYGRCQIGIRVWWKI